MITYHFGGSRSLPFSPIIAQVVTASLAAGYSVQVGCAIGADAQVIQACLNTRPDRLHVFAAFTANGEGRFPGSAVATVDAACKLGALVDYLPDSELAIPLAGRLIRRSVAALFECNASAFFLATPISSGSLAVAGAAVRVGQPVFAFSVGFSGFPGCPHGCDGRWISTQFMGSYAWRWQPAQSKLI